MSEQPQTEEKESQSVVSVRSVLTWVVAGVLIGVSLFGITLIFNRTSQPQATVGLITATPAPIMAAAVSAITPTLLATDQPPNVITYTVQSGDVLSAIAERFGVGASVIRQANAETLLNPDRLQVGQVLRIPSTASAIQTQAVQPTSAPPQPTLAFTPQKYVIARGEVLSTIALKFGISVEALRAANNLPNDIIRAGDTLIIPVPANATASAPATQTTTPAPPYTFSILEGDLQQAYPLSSTGSNFALHYQPDTPAAEDIQAIVNFLEQAQKSITKSLGVRFAGRFDVYLAGTLFAPPNHALRGRSFSNRRVAFVLYDGSGNAAERHYMLAHELTHLIAWNSYGPAKSAMLSEGAAVFAGEQYLLAGDFLSIRNFCLAYRRADQLPLVASPNLDFRGHLLSLDGYYASGCFVQYLLKTYGTAKFSKLYSSLDYQGIYGRSLTQLQRNWLASLDADKTKLPFSAQALPTAYEALLKDYSAFFASVGNGDVNTTIYSSYSRLDSQRLNVLMGKLN